MICFEILFFPTCKMHFFINNQPVRIKKSAEKSLEFFENQHKGENLATNLTYTP